MKDKKYKLILYITLIPYIILLLTSLYYSIFGYYLSYMDEYIYGIDAFLASINDIWFYVIRNPILIVLLIILVIYQIGYFIIKSKLPFKKILLYISIICWIIYILSGIYHMIYGYCDGLFSCTKVYGIDALFSSLFWYGFSFTIIPVLPLTLIYIIIYTIKLKRK